MNGAFVAYFKASTALILATLFWFRDRPVQAQQPIGHESDGKPTLASPGTEEETRVSDGNEDFEEILDVGVVEPNTSIEKQSSGSRSRGGFNYEVVCLPFLRFRGRYATPKTGSRIGRWEGGHL